MINAIVVEDEIAVRAVLRKRIKAIDENINIVSECGDMKSAETAIKVYMPDIIFLDIVLPGGTSFKLLENLLNIKSEIIFITAHDKYMLEAFKYAAIGYVLKPINTESLKVAISNARKRINEKETKKIEYVLNYLLENGSKSKQCKLGVPTPGGLTFLRHDEILRLEGSNSYTTIYLHDSSKIISSYNIAKFIDIIPGNIFFRTHRSHIISLPNACKYHSKEATIEMDNGDIVPLSKNMKSAFVKTFTAPHK